MKIKKRNFKILIFTLIIFFLISTISIPTLAESGNENQGGNSNNSQQSEPKGPNSGSQNDNNSPGEQNQQQNPEKNQNQNIGENGNKKQQQNQKGKEDNDGDQVDDRRERHQNRYMQMICYKNKTHIRSEWQHNKSSDAFEVSFIVEEAPKLIFDYISDTNKSEIDLRFIISINKIFEYHDINENGRYNKNDIIETSYLLNNTNFTDIEYSYENSSDGEEITLISATTEDGIFTIILYLSGNFSQLNNQTLSPSEIKMDFIINNYPFSYNNTLIAIEVDLETKHETSIEIVTFDEKQGYSKNESEINISSFNYNGFFSWADYVFVDNKLNIVNVTVISDKEETIIGNITVLSHIRQIYFSYPQGKNITHDPKAGVVSISYESYSKSSILNDVTNIIDTLFADIITYVGICIFAAILFIGVIFFRKRILN